MSQIVANSGKFGYDYKFENVGLGSHGHLTNSRKITSNRIDKKLPNNKVMTSKY